MVKSAIVPLFFKSLLISMITFAVVFGVGNTDTARTMGRDIFAQAPAASNVPNYTSIRANLKMIFTKGITVQNGLNVSGNIEAPGSNLNLGSGNITAANIIYSLVAGDGVSITGSKQNPTIGISNVGSIAVSSIEEIKGDVDLVAGDNVTISKDGNKITIKSSYTDTDTKLTEGEVESYAFDGVAYTWPDSQGGAGTFLQNDGSGNLSWATNSFSISPDSLDFTDFADNMTLDATTSVAMGVYDYHFIGNGGTSAFTIKNSGKVGIGTTDPGKKLEVAGVNEGLRLRHDGTYYADITIDSSGNINLSPYLNSDNAVISLNNAPFIRSNTAAVSLAIGVGANPNMNTSDWGNVAVGTGALQGQTTSYFNTAVGTYAATSLGSGNWLTAVGYAALQNDTVGVNTAVGSQAGRGLVSGMYNTVIGRLGLRNNISGNSNTVLGESAGYNTLGSGNLFLGYGAGYNEAGSNKLYIDNSTTSSPLLWGDFSSNFLNVNGNLGIGTTAPAFPLQVEGNPSAGFGIGSGAPKLAFGWADNSVYHRIRSAGGDNSNIILDLVNPATHYFAVGGDFQVSQGATIGYGIGTARPSSGLAVSGSVGIGTTSPTYKLDVIGTANVSSTFSAAGTTQIDTWGIATNNVRRMTENPLYLWPSSTYSGDAMILQYQSSAGNSNVSGIQNFMKVNPSFLPGSGIATFNAINLAPIINQTGGANGISRGIYINPTLTSASDWRSIEVATGNVLFGITSGNVGIGTTSPTTKLHIVGDMRLTGAFYDSTNSAGTNGLLLTSTGVGTTWSSIAGALGGSVFLNDGNAFGGLATLGTTDANALRFITAGTEAMRVLTNGNVGIGTTSPSSQMELNILNAATKGLIVKANSGQTASLVEVQKSDGTALVKFDPYVTNGGTAYLFDTVTNFANPNNGTYLSLKNAGNEILKIYKQTGAGNETYFDLKSAGGASTFSTLFDGGTLNFTKSGVKYLELGGEHYPLFYRNTGVGSNVRGMLSGNGGYGGSGNATFAVAGNAANQVPIVLKGYSGQTANLFEVQNSSNSNLFIIDANGNVGIGTTSPLNALHITADYSRIRLESSHGGTDDWLIGGDSTPAGLLFTNITDNATYMFLKENGNLGIGTTNPFTTLDVSGTSWLRGSTAASGGLYVNGSGNVGIGTTSPANKLDINGSLALGSGYVGNTAPSSGAIIQGNVGIGTMNPRSKLSIGGSVDISDGTDNGLGLALWTNNTGDFASNIAAYNLGFYTGNNNSRTERMRITNAGNVGIGNTGSSAKLDVNGTVRLTYNSTNYADIGISNTGRLQLAPVSGMLQIGSTSPNFSLRSSDFNTQYMALAHDSSNGSLYNYIGSFNIRNIAANNLSFGTNNTTRATIDSSGNFGVNTQSPASVLDVAGTSWLRGSTAASGGLYVNGSGNVGIGTTSPAYKLDVVANTYADGVRFKSYTDNATPGPNVMIGGYNGGDQWAYLGLGSEYYSSGKFTASTSNPTLFGLHGAQTMLFADSGITVGGTYNPTARITILNTSGNVGINNNSPSSILDVAGTSWLRGSTAASGGLYVNGSGNVGIGTTSPGAKLEVYDGEILLNGSTLGATKQIRSYSDSGKLSLVSGSTTNYQSQIILAARNGGDYISLSTRNNEAMRIDSSGNIGIGTTAPAGKFHVRTGNDENIYIDRASNIYGGTTGVGIGARNDTGLSTASLTLDGTSILIPRTTTFIGLGTTAASFPIDVASSVSSSQTYGYLNSAGTVGTSSGSNSYSIRASSRILASEFNAVSDARLKDVQYELSPDVALNALLQLQPVSYTWKNNPSGQPILGFLAQDVEKVVPNAVSMISTSNFVDQRELNYNQLIAVAIGAIKKQEQKIQQQAEILKGIQNDNVVVETSRRDVSTEQYEDKIASIEATLSSLKTDMDIVKGNSYTASISAFLAANSGSVLGASDSASLSDLIVSGDTNVYDLAVAGDISTGLLKIQGLACDDDIISPLAGDTCASDISTLGGPLVLQGQAQEELQIMAGKVVVDTSGNITTQGEITVKKVNIDTSDTAAAAAGKSTLEAGKSEITIPTMAVTSNSLIQVTFRGNYAPATRYWIESQKPGESFTLKLDQAVQKNTDFSWMIVN